MTSPQLIARSSSHRIAIENKFNDVKNVEIFVNLFSFSLASLSQRISLLCLIKNSAHKKCIRSLLIDDCSCLTVSPSTGEATRKRPWEILSQQQYRPRGLRFSFISIAVVKVEEKWLSVDNGENHEKNDERAGKLTVVTMRETCFTSFSARLPDRVIANCSN